MLIKITVAHHFTPSIEEEISEKPVDKSKCSEDSGHGETEALPVGTQPGVASQKSNLIVLSKIVCELSPRSPVSVHTFQ